MTDNLRNLASKLDTGSGSGSEVDRYESHFGLGHDGIEQLKKAASMKGAGAEQDRYDGHFGLDAEKIKEATNAFLNAKGTGAEQDVHSGHFGLGYDGLERVKQLTNMKGVGAEQVGAD